MTIVQIHDFVSDQSDACINHYTRWAPRVRVWRGPWSVRIETRDGERELAPIEGLTLTDALEELGIVLRHIAGVIVEIRSGNAVRARLEVPGDWEGENRARAWAGRWSVRIETRDGERELAPIEGLTLAEALDELGIVLRQLADVSVEIGCGRPALPARARLEVHDL
jgi:sulfur carrier protein ThiS